MGRRPAWRRILQSGVGMTGWMTAFLFGMAAAVVFWLMSAGGGLSESGNPIAGSDASRTVLEAREDGERAAGGPRFSRDESGMRKEKDEIGARAGEAVGQVGGRHQAAIGAANGIKDDGIGQAGAPDEPMVRVYLASEKRVETVPLETYVRGVTAGEMPTEFELEALKAQAIAARTYIIRKLLTEGRVAADSGLVYDVTDGKSDQVYISLERMRQLGLEREQDMERIGRAVEETKGLVLTYEGEPIQAAYFSTSGGYTENAEEYWSAAVPYLVSVPSPWDAQLSPRFEQTIDMTLDEFYDRLGIGKRDRKGGMEVLSRTKGRSVKEIRIGKRVLTGREVREALDLPSANFSWRIRDGRIALTCYGHGHGVGMSQWGAQALALAGNGAEQILAYYYPGTRISRSASLAPASESFKT